MPSARCLHPRTHRPSAATLEHGASLSEGVGCRVREGTPDESPAAHAYARVRYTPRSPRSRRVGSVSG